MVCFSEQISKLQQQQKMVGSSSLFGKTTTTEQTTIVLAEKIVHKGQLHGLVESSGLIPLSELFSLKITVNNNYCNLQVVSGGIGNKLNFKKEVRPKIIKEKIKPATITTEVVAQKELF